METPRPLLKLSPSFTAAARTPLKHSPAAISYLLSNRNHNSSSSSSSSSSASIIHCCYYTKKNKPPPRKTPTTSTTTNSSSSYWDSNAETFRSDGYNKFKFRDEESIEEGDDYEDFDSSNSRFRWRENRKRKWWSDGADDDDDDDYPQGNGGVVEDVIDNVWIFKVFRSFGWLLPAIIISMLLATGPKAFLMALALPLGQSAVSFAIDKVFGRAQERPKSRPPRTKRKPFSRAASAVEVNEEEELQESGGYGEGKQGYQSWVATDNGSVQQKVDQRKPSFGGWDELDGRQGSEKGARRRRTGPLPGKGLEKGKMSKRGRRGDTPLLLRLLIAVFPFLGSWTRLF